MKSEEKTGVQPPKIFPCAGRYLVRRDDPAKMTKGGLILPQTHARPPRVGTILRVGAEKMTDYGQKKPMEYKTGDRIIFTVYSGTEVHVTDPETNSDVELMLLNADEIVGKIEEGVEISQIH